MMRGIVRVVILFTCILFMAAAADAKERIYYVGVDGLYVMQSIDEQQTKDKFTGSMDVDFDDSWGVRLNGGWVINKYFTSEAMFEYVAPFEAKTGGNKDELDVMNFTINGKFTCPAYKGKGFVPYGLLGVGIMNAYEDISYNSSTSKTSDWGASVRAGIGVDYYINACYSLKLEGAYVSGLGNLDHIRYSEIAFGAAYHF